MVAFFFFSSKGLATRSKADNQPEEDKCFED